MLIVRKIVPIYDVGTMLLLDANAILPAEAGSLRDGVIYRVTAMKITEEGCFIQVTGPDAPADAWLPSEVFLPATISVT